MTDWDPSSGQQQPPQYQPPPYQPPQYQQPQYQQFDQGPDPYGRRPPPRRNAALPALIGALVALLLVLGVGGGWLLTHRKSTTAAAPTPVSSSTEAAAPTFSSAAPRPSTARVTVTATTVAAATVPPSTRAPATSRPAGTNPAGIDVSAIEGNPFEPAVASMFAVYFGGVNAHDGSIVNTVLYHKLKVSTYEKAIRTTTDDQIAVLTLAPDPASPADLISEVSFRSTQAAALGPNGESCTLWDNTYRLRPSHGRYQIYKSVATHIPC